MSHVIKDAKATPPIEKNARLRLVSLGVGLLGLLIIVKLFHLQIGQHAFYTLIGSEKHEVLAGLIPERGSMYVEESGELFPLVTNREYYTVYAEPKNISEPNKTIDVLAAVLGLSKEEWQPLLEKFGTDDPYEPVKTKVPKDQWLELRSHELDGVGAVSVSYRYYPEKNIGGHIFGFVSRGEKEGVGQYGLEGYFQNELRGTSGLVQSVRDARGALITVGQRSINPATDGSDLVLTIDRRVQYQACQTLKHYYDYFDARKGTVVIMRPTGAILAMCSFPDFDPETYNKVDNINSLNNPAIFYDFEPGSIFKPFTMSAAIDTGKVTPQDTYIDEGEVKIGPYTIRNSDLKAHGEQTMIDVLDKSLNTGTIYVADKLGKSAFKRYVERFGFGELTGIELDTEVPGNISSLENRGDIYYLTGSYGQGITATAIQLVTGYAALANGGKLPQPYIVSKIIDADGTVTETEPKVVRQVIGEKTATLITGMLTSVVENGYGAKAGVEGYYLAGKTGTAQVASPEGGYGSETIHSFVGYGPVSDPQFVMLVMLDNPKGIKFASDSVTPLFREIAEFILQHYRIQPEK